MSNYGRIVFFVLAGALIVDAAPFAWFGRMQVKRWIGVSKFWFGKTENRSVDNL
jgi:hypothetical protein